MIRYRVAHFMLFAGLAVLLSGRQADAQEGAFVPTGSTLDGGLYRHSALRLLDGRVFVVGGNIEAPAGLTSAEAYDPATGTFSIVGTISTPGGNLVSLSASLLPSGRVLVAGGMSGGAVLASTEIWDPTTSAFTSGAPMTSPRALHVAVQLLDGRILVAGGISYTDSPPAMSSAEIYDPAANSWTPTVGSMLHARREHKAVLLADGRVLIVGGDAAYPTDPTNACEIFDPATGTFSEAASMAASREGFGIARLVDGRVLVVGGSSSSTTGAPVHDAELYDPAANSWSSAGSLSGSGFGVTLTTLPDGRVLAAGGMIDYTGLKNADLYDPASNSWTAQPPMATGRIEPSATLLLDGSVLITAGVTYRPSWINYSSAERFVPAASNSAPSADAGADQTAEATSASATNVVLSGSGSSDPDGDALTFSWTGDFGGATGVSPTVSLGLGVHTVTLTVTDIHGASSADTVLITVSDTTAPMITALTATPNVLTTPNHKMAAVALTGIATDACDAHATLSIASITSNEPTEGLGDGDTPIDWVVTGAMTLELRAERSGKGTGRIYTITVRATDAAGNSSLKAVTVTVPKGK